MAKDINTEGNKMSKDKRTAGRPTDYREEYEQQAEKLCLLGATDEDMADFFGVTPQTIGNWKNKHDSFFEAIKRGKRSADANVANSLYQRATGYEHPDTKFATHEGKITDEREYVKHYAPDPVAAIFWLKNRQPKHWRDKQEVEQTNFNVTISGDDADL